MGICRLFELCARVGSNSRMINRLDHNLISLDEILETSTEFNSYTRVSKADCITRVVGSSVDNVAKNLAIKLNLTRQLSSRTHRKTPRKPDYKRSSNKKTR
jgi:hypothetical protein